MVGVARIELATPAMSTPEAPAKLLNFQGFSMGQAPDFANLAGVFQSTQLSLNQSNTVGNQARFPPFRRDTRYR